MSKTDEKKKSVRERQGRGKSAATKSSHTQKAYSYVEKI